FRRAYDCFRALGAARKVEHLVETYGAMFTNFKTDGHTTVMTVTHSETAGADTYNVSNNELDIESILKASASFSREVHRERLMNAVITTIKENVGATKVALLLHDS